MNGPRRALLAFTMIEVLLAVGIIAGLLVVVLFFYQQAAQLRTELLLDAERSAAARLLMDRVTGELRTARTHSYYATPMAGGADYIQFITTDLPSQANWSGERFGRITRPETDLKFVRYGLEVSAEDTNVVGLTRTEEPLVEFRTVAATSAVLQATETNRTSALVITDQFRFVWFRYWDGYGWVEEWNHTALPRGIEVSLGAEALPPETEPAEYPYEVFRRVIYLPNSAPVEEDPFFDLLDPAPKTAEVRR
ncbi:MAG: type II secretion system GspH family protein [Verrucomicrobia subdivision 3 bacterium]|nr:type II secretion system GspH family protein [Limisphaerales bacterium]